MLSVSKETSDFQFILWATIKLYREKYSDWDSISDPDTLAAAIYISEVSNPEQVLKDEFVKRKFKVTDTLLRYLNKAEHNASYHNNAPEKLMCCVWFIRSYSKPYTDSFMRMYKLFPALQKTLENNDLPF